MKISVGSKNPVKIAAAKKALERLGIDAELVEAEVPSGVKPQPMSNAEGIEGAINRARASMERTGADIGIGMEGTVEENKYGMFLTGWAAAVDKSGRLGIGSSAGVLLPERIAKELREGKELGDVIDKVKNSKGIRTREGTIGVLTKGVIVREDEFYSALIMALARIINKEYYE